MLYQVHMVTKDGKRTVLHSVDSVERAMRIAYPALLRGGVVDARIVDDDGIERADLVAITKHCMGHCFSF